jgi:NAD(P)-dependent dehydrogenase (short-subunit alcohol dehydrogenase family)
VQLKGSVVAVSGGARGIGAATAGALAARGARVAIGDLDVELAERTAADLPGVIARRLDVADPDAWLEFLGAVESELGPVDALVSNAGVMPISPFADESDESTRRQIDVNLYGVILGARAVLGGMLERRRGVLVNVASQAGKAAFGGLATYCATKYAVVGLSHALTDELRGTGVRVSCVLPGVVDTELSSGMTATPLTPRVAPAQVAEAIAGAIETPRKEVWVPPSGRLVIPLADAVPRGIRARALSLLGIGDPVSGHDAAQRAAYEARVAAERDEARL